MLRVEGCKKLATLRVEVSAGGAESFPKRVGLTLGDARTLLLVLLPLGKQLINLRRGALPLDARRRLGGELFDFSDDRFAVGDSFGKFLLLLFVLLFAELVEVGADLVQAGAQALEVANGIGGDQLFLQGFCTLGDVTGVSAGAHSLLKQLQLPGQIIVFPGEVGECFFRGPVGILAYLALFATIGDIDGAVGFNAAERVLGEFGHDVFLSCSSS